MKNKKMIPDIRFKGFSEEWEEKKLGEVAEFFKGKGYTKSDLKEEGFPIILYGRLYTEYETIIDNVDTFVEYDDNSVKSKKGDVIIPSSGETSIDIARASVVNDDDIILGGDLNIIKLKEKIQPVFLALDISHGRQQKELSKKAQGKSIVHLHNSDIEKVKLIYPSLKEQEKIGDLFSKLDNIIELQEDKLENYREYKKSMLQKLFPKKDKKVPELRFKGFSGEWEEKKLGEVADIKTGRKDVKDAVENGQYPFFIRSDEVKTINSYSYDGEAILIPGEGRLGEIFHYINGKFDFHQRVYKISDFKNINSQYLLYYMISNFKRHAMKYTVKATVDSLRLPMLTKFKILIPSLPEQEKIGTFFKNLDNIIEKQELELENYKNFKKSMLQKLFV